MKVIKLLSPEDAAKLAATEIVERPESVVKECIENSLDAGASEIKIRVIGGGLELIEVQDNGEGIIDTDLELAVQRFATSKIKTYSDLNSLQTFGFRGEALYAINQVSNLEISSRHKDATHGVRCRWSNGTLIDRAVVSRSRGTTVRVESLFANVPARLKCQSSTISEKKRIRSLVRAYAIVRRDCGFTLETESFEDNYPLGDFRIFDIFGAELARLSGEVGYVTVDGYLGLKSLGAKGEFFVFVNDRPVYDKLIMKAVRDRLAGLVKSDRDLAGYINVRLSPALVDFNVHPRKLEVRFVDNSSVYKAVYRLIEPQKLGSKNIISLIGVTKSEPFQHCNIERNPDSSSSDFQNQHKLSPNPEQDTESTWSKTFNRSEYACMVGDSEISEGEQMVAVEMEKVEVRKDLLGSELLFENGLRAKFLGTFAQGYLVYSIKGGGSHSEQILIVDPHAARERELFNEIISQIKLKVASQKLLFPLTIDGEFSSDTVAELERYGFIVSPENGFLKVKAIPMVVYKYFHGNLHDLTSLINDEREGEFSLEAFCYALAAKAACRSSHMLGDSVSELEATLFLEKILKLEQIYCPHGRRFIFKLERKAVDEFFGRRA